LVIDTLSAKADGMYVMTVTAPHCVVFYVTTQVSMDCLPAGYVADAFQQVSVTLLVNYSKHWMEHTNASCWASKKKSENTPLACSSVLLPPFALFALKSSQRFLRCALNREIFLICHVGWRLDDVREAVLSACFSIVVVARDTPIRRQDSELRREIR
jgi:hypothetical protein